MLITLSPVSRGDAVAGVACRCIRRRNLVRRLSFNATPNRRLVHNRRKINTLKSGENQSSDPYDTISSGLELLKDLDQFITKKSLWMERYLTACSINKNKEMVKILEHHKIIKSKRVTEAMESVDRGIFVPQGSSPYVDFPVPIGYNATISAPHMHAMCLQLLEPNLKPGMRVLDVGSGTGYLTACFALMVGAQGRAIGVEHIPELAESSIANIEKSAAAPLMKEGTLSIHICDGREGFPDLAPYDAIHVGAAAPEIPEALIRQLKAGGVMVIPVGNVFQDLQVVCKDEEGKVTIRTETSVRYVPLTSRDSQLK